jgi:hypothetical protein
MVAGLVDGALGPDWRVNSRSCAVLSSRAAFEREVKVGFALRVGDRAFGFRAAGATLEPQGGSGGAGNGSRQSALVVLQVQGQHRAVRGTQRVGSAQTLRPGHRTDQRNHQNREHFHGCL